MRRLNLWGVAALQLVITTQASAETRLSREEQKARLEKAVALFREHCKTAGEFIRRTVDDVEGIYLLKVRPSETNRGNQFDMDDPYGHDSGGEWYLKSFLHGFHNRSPNYVRGDPTRYGYRYVEAINPQDRKRYRYTGHIEEPWQYDKSYLKGYKRFVLDKAPAPSTAPRYGVTYDDISTREDRELWIAGSSLKVIDLKINEVIAERIGYMIDLGQGANGGGRSPWLMAADNACPGFQRYVKPVVRTPGAAEQGNQTDDFVEKVLHPIGESK